MILLGIIVSGHLNGLPFSYTRIPYYLIQRELIYIYEEAWLLPGIPK